MLILVNEFRSVMSFPTVKQIMVVAKLMDGFIEGFVQVKYIAGTYLRSFLSLGQDDDGEEARALRALQLEFEVPRNFLNPDKYRPDHVPEDDFGEVPDVITRSIFDVMDANVPIDALNPFIYLRSGRLPEFVVVFFMNMVAKRVKSKMSRFFHAMHLIEMYREYIIVPPHHFLASVDTAAVVPTDAVGAVATDVDKDDEDKKEKEDKESSGSKDDKQDDRKDEPSTSNA